MTQESSAGVVVLAATPIGDVAMPPRLVAELTNADDRRRDTRRLRRCSNGSERDGRESCPTRETGDAPKSSCACSGRGLESSSSATPGCPRCPTRAIASSPLQWHADSGSLLCPVPPPC